MNICVLMGSMRKNGNTEMLIRPFVDQLKSQDVEVQYIWLCDKHIEPCKSCFVCQDIDDKPGCSIKDEMEQIYKSILEANCIVFCYSNLLLVLYSTNEGGYRQTFLYE